MKTLIKITGIILLSIMTICCNSTREKADPVRVLLITGGHDFDEEPFYALMNSLQGITVSEVKHPDALAMFRPENRSSYDVVLLYDMPNRINEQEKTDFIDCLNEGKGLIVWHHAYCAYQDWPEYKTIIGGRYFHRPWTDDNGDSQPPSRYRHDVELRINVADTEHPITKDLQDFDIIDEAYLGGAVNQGVHVLLTTDNPLSTPAVAWTNSYGKSKVVTILLGHDDLAWTNPDFVKLLTQAILWAK